MLDCDAFRRDLLSSDIIMKPTDNCDSFCGVYDCCLSELVDKHSPIETRVVRRLKSRSAPLYNHECHLVKSTTLRLKKIYHTTHCHNVSAIASPVYCAADCFSKSSHLLLQLLTNVRTRAVCSGKLAPFNLWPLQSASIQLRRLLLSSAKVDSIRETTMNALQLTIHYREVPCSDAFRRSRRMTYSRFFGRLQTNYTSLIQMGDVLAPVFTDMINRSFEQGCFPSSQKEAIFGPRLKKQSLDRADLKSYRPISNKFYIKTY